MDMWTETQKKYGKTKQIGRRVGERTDGRTDRKGMDAPETK